MYKNIFLKSLFIAILINGFLACDNDSNELGADIIGADNFETGTPETYDVVASTKNLEKVETLDLPVNALGIYKNPVFGTLKANIAVQLEMANNALNPTFDPVLEPQIQSVTLRIPYFSTKGETRANGDTEYTLDSIYGPANQKIQLRIYESKYYIRDLDPITQTAQKYYNTQNSEFDAAKGRQLNTLEQNDQFFFSSAEIQDPGTVTPEDQDPDPIRSAPAMNIKLDPEFFNAKILKALPGKLLNNNVFKEYFRGLYFQVAQSGSDEGNLAMLNIKGGKITIKYKQLKEARTATLPNPGTEDKTYVLNMTGKSVGFFDTESTLSQDADHLYLKGGEGSMAIIDLFTPEKLAELRANKWLVNDASLTFYIDNAAMGSAAEPNRVYLYDFNNKRPLTDYYTDQISSSRPKFAKPTHGGIIKKTDGRGTYYKVRLTNHIRGLLNNLDSTNVRLGLVVTEDITNVTNRKLKAPVAEVKEVPVSSIMNPLGTILHGSGNGVPDNKKLRLKIYYTKPKQN